MTALAIPEFWQHIVAMPVDRLTDAVTRAARDAPCSVRALARAADVPASTLVRIVAGERAATPAVAAAVARALDQWGAKCGQLALGIRQAQRGGQNG
jgi:Helix-turn-helix